MTDREALYQSVLAHPDADLPRLVFADWLDENGEEPLAAFIRMQCEMARVPKWDPIWIHGCWVDRSWVTSQGRFPKGLAPLGCSQHAVTYRRGFPWGLFVNDLSLFLSSAADTFARHVIGSLLLYKRDLPLLTALFSSPWLPRIHRLGFFLGSREEAVQPLLASERINGLDALHFKHGAIVAGGLTALFGSPLSQQLRELGLECNFETDSGQAIVTALRTGASMPVLERLDLTRDQMSGADVMRVLESLDAPKLNRLELSECGLGIDGARLLANSRRLASIESLNLTKTNPGANGVKFLAASSHLGNLKVLKLRNNRLGPVAVKALVAASWFPNLHVLALDHCNISDNGAKAIANAPASANLRVLDLTRNAITDPGAKALLDSPHLTSLIHLDLKENEIGPKLLDALRKRFGGQIGWERVVSPKKKR